jgi:hypothetical protein
MPARTGARLHEPSVGATDDWYTPPSIFDALPPGDSLDDFTA